MANKNLNAAKVAKKDEFYTQLSDIEDEVNGLITYDREVVKCDQEIMRGIAQRIYALFDGEVGNE